MWGKIASIASGNPFRAVDAADRDVPDAALLEIAEDLHRELRALGLLKPHAEDVAVALNGDAHGQVDVPQSRTIQPQGPQVVRAVAIPSAAAVGMPTVAQPAQLTAHGRGSGSSWAQLTTGPLQGPTMDELMAAVVRLGTELERRAIAEGQARALDWFAVAYIMAAPYASHEIALMVAFVAAWAAHRRAR